MRTNKVIGIIGGRGSGKTTLGKALADVIYEGNPAMSLVVVDTFDHPDYRNGYLTITPDLVGRIINRGKYRVFGGDTDEIMSAIQEGSRNQILLFEDASKYIGSNVPDDVRRFTLDSKQKNLDIILMFHGFGFVPPTIWRLMDGLILLKTNDSPEIRKSLIPNYAEVKAAYDRIKSSSEKYPRESIIIA